MLVKEDKGFLWLMFAGINMFKIFVLLYLHFIQVQV